MLTSIPATSLSSTIDRENRFESLDVFFVFFFFLFETISDKHRIGHTFISAMKESIWWKVEDIDIRADNLGYSVVRKERKKR